MNIDNDNFVWLQEWYAKQSNGIWEHSYGIKIDTIDNPGWKIIIDLKSTAIEGFEEKNTFIERSDYDWFSYKIIDNQFLGYCGVNNLGELIYAFRQIFTKLTSL